MAAEGANKFLKREFVLLTLISVLAVPVHGGKSKRFYLTARLQDALASSFPISSPWYGLFLPSL